MQSSNYKLIRDARIKIKNYLDTSNIELTNANIFNIMREILEVDVNFKNLDSASQLKLLNICAKDYKSKKKNKLNNVLGRKSHLFHVVFPSIWPFLTSVAAFFFLSSLLFLFNGIEGAVKIFFFAFLLLLIFMYCWFRTIIDEATFKGHHTLVVRRGLIYGFWLFIASE